MKSDLPILPMLLEPEQGQGLWVLGDPYIFKVTGEQTNGQYALAEVTVSPQAGTPPHIHGVEHEAFYVLSGEVTFVHASGAQRVKAGGFVQIPPGAVHAYKNETASPARMLVLLTPAGFERFFQEIGTPISDAPAPPPVTPALLDRMMDIAPHYHLEFA